MEIDTQCYLRSGSGSPQTGRTRVPGYARLQTAVIAADSLRIYFELVTFQMYFRSVAFQMYFQIVALSMYFQLVAFWMYFQSVCFGYSVYLREFV